MRAGRRESLGCEPKLVTWPPLPLARMRCERVKHGARLSAKAISTVRWAAKIEPLSDSHCTGCGARIPPKRCLTQRTIMSRIISPGMPAVVAIEGRGDHRRCRAATLPNWMDRLGPPATVRLRSNRGAVQ